MTRQYLTQRRIRNRTYLAVIAAIALVCALAAVPAYGVFRRIDAARTLYLGFVEAMYSNTPIRVNFLPSREHSFPFAVRRALTVAIDSEIDPAYLTRVKSAFSVMTRLMGSTVTFRNVNPDFDFRDDYYVYVGYKKDRYAFRPSYIADFTDKLHGAISKLYGSKRDDLLWERFRLGPTNMVFGTGFLFNAEYNRIPYNELVEESDKIRASHPNAIPATAVIEGDVSYKLNNASPTKGVFFVSTRNDSTVVEAKFREHTNDTITQEIFQGLIQQNDLNGPFRLKTLLDDYDDVANIVKPLSDSENIDIANKHAARGLCLLDTIYLLHLGSVDAEDFRWQLLKSNWFTYAKLYLQAYSEYRKGPAELFDSRCW